MLGSLAALAALAVIGNVSPPFFYHLLTNNSNRLKAWLDFDLDGQERKQLVNTHFVHL